MRQAQEEKPSAVLSRGLFMLNFYLRHSLQKAFPIGPLAVAESQPSQRTKNQERATPPEAKIQDTLLCMNDSPPL
jgi:hypothetical protein